MRTPDRRSASVPASAPASIPTSATAQPARTVWLASYPKSGNTWFRIFIANLLHPEQAPVNLNDLPERTPIASSRGHFDDLLGLPSALLTQAEIDRLRPAADAELARVWDEPLLLRKAHDGYQMLPDGRPMMGTGPEVAAIYILRDPWDVAVSMTNHFGCTLEQAVENLCNPEFAMARSRKGLNGQLRQDLGSWEAHARGWLEAPMDLCLLRYERMKAAPLTEFRRAVRFLGLEHGDNAIEAALEASRFERLAQQEAEQRFREAPTKTRTFFRRGVRLRVRRRVRRSPWPVGQRQARQRPVAGQGEAAVAVAAGHESNPRASISASTRSRIASSGWRCSALSCARPSPTCPRRKKA
jgi:hypothetical protein